MVYKNPLVTIVTVVFNDVNHIEDTILDVLHQSYNDIEYIVIDGGSTDGTIEVIEKYSDGVDCWLSEKDKGIYDAMNKGVLLAKGEFINFMNSGDSFFCRDTVKNVINSIYIKNLDSVDVIYGGHQVKTLNGMKNVNPGEIYNIYRGSQFCHQSVFISTEFHRNHKYNISNRIAADFEFFYRAVKSNRNFLRIDEVVSSILPGGISDLNRVEALVSWWNVVDKSTGTNIYYISRIIREMIALWVKKGLSKLNENTVSP